MNISRIEDQIGVGAILGTYEYWALAAEWKLLAFGDVRFMHLEIRPFRGNDRQPGSSYEAALNMV